jgi:hypothetical protein
MNHKNRFKANNSFTNETGIHPNDSFCSLFGKPENMDHFTQIANTEQYKLLSEKYKSIFKAGYDEGLQPGEVQVLIFVFSDGKPLNEIEYRRLDDLKLFVKHNSINLLSWINPELHAFLLRTGYFKKSRHITVKQSRLKRICKIIESLSKKNNSNRKLVKFAEILSKL